MIADNLFAVIDGATDVLGHVHPVRGINSSAFLAGWLSAFFAQMPQDISLEEGLWHAVAGFRACLRDEWPDMLEIGTQGPSASVILVRVEDKGYSFAQLGDAVLLEKRAGKWKTMTTESTFHTQADKAMHEKMRALIQKGVVAPQEAVKHPEIVRLIKETRDSMNKYYAPFNASEACFPFIMSGTASFEDLEALALLSDGMNWPLEDGDGYEIAAEKIARYGNCAQYHKEMIERLDKDPGKEKYLRFKHADDASAVFLFAGKDTICS